jgi:hypothetical protein
MATRFMRPEPPLLMDTADFGRPKCAATSAMSSLLALPSTGGDFNCAIHTPGLVSSSRLWRALGLALT